METNQSSLLKDFFQGYEPLQYALEPNESPIFNDYQDTNFQTMYDLLKNKYDTKEPMTKKNIFIISFCVTSLILLLINSRFKLLSTYDENKNRVPNMKVIVLLALIVSLLVAAIN